MNRGSLRFDEHVDPHRLAEQIADALRRVDAKDVFATADRVSFTGGMFRFVTNWNVLVPFTRGELIINADARRLDYRVSFRQLVLTLLIFSVGFLVFMLASGFPLSAIPVFLGMTWLWLGGLNVLIGRVRFEHFLRKAIHAAGVPTVSTKAD